MTNPTGTIDRQSPSGKLLPPSELVGAFRSVPNLAQLALFQPGNTANGYPDGFPIWVVSLRAWFTLETSAFAPVAFERVNSAEAGRQWCRQLPSYALGAGNPWLSQTQWYIGGGGASDENPGTITLPIATLAEWLRRVGESELNAIYTLHVALPFIGTASMSPRVGVNGMVVVDCQPSITSPAQTVCAAFTDIAAPPIPAGSEYALIQGAPGWDWTAHVGLRTRVVDQVTGATLGIFWVEEVSPGLLANDWARITRPCLTDLGVNPPALAAVVPIAGNLLVVENPGTVISDTILSPRTSRANTCGIIVANATFSSPIALQAPIFNNILLYGCQLFVSVNGNGQLWACSANVTTGVLDLIGNSPEQPLLVNRCGFGHGVHAFVTHVANCVLDNTIFQASQLRHRAFGNIIGNDAIGIFDLGAGVAALSDADSGKLTMQLTANCDLYGWSAGGAMAGIFLQNPSSMITYAAANPPTVATGEGAEIRNCAVATTYALGINLINAATGSGVMSVV